MPTKKPKPGLNIVKPNGDVLNTGTGKTTPKKQTPIQVKSSPMDATARKQQLDAWNKAQALKEKQMKRTGVYPNTAN